MSHALARTLDRVRTLFAPQGKHRIEVLSSHPAPWRWSTVCIGTAEPPFDQPQAEIAPTARPWYTPIDATSTPLVRPYLAAREREEEARLQQVRRDTPWWATYGVDLDARDLHACLGVAS